MGIAAHWPDLLLIYGGFLIATISPGPSFLMVASTAMARRANGVAAAIGIVTGSLSWAAFALMGLAALVAASPILENILRGGGGAYLIWLGLLSLRRKAKLQPSDGLLVSSDLKRSFQKALLLHLTNPKAAMFWLSMTALVIEPNLPWIVYGALFAGVAAIGLAWNLSLVFVFSSRPAQQAYLSMQRPIAILFGLLFIALGLRLWIA